MSTTLDRLLDPAGRKSRPLRTSASTGEPGKPSDVRNQAKGRQTRRAVLAAAYETHLAAALPDRAAQLGRDSVSAAAACVR